MKLYVIRSEIDGTYFLQNGTLQKWVAFDDCTIGEKTLIENIFANMPKKYISEKHPVICAIKLVAPTNNTEDISVSVQTQVEEKEVPKILTKKDIPIEEYINKDFSEILNTTDCSEYTIQLLQALENVIKINADLFDNATKNLSIADRKLCDIYHYIELNSFSGVKGYRLCKEQKKILTERRISKNEGAISQYINSLIKGLDLPTLAKLKYNCSQLSSREYAPREIEVDKI